MQSIFYRTLVVAAISILTLGIFVAERLAAESTQRSLRIDNSLEIGHWREAQSCGVACGYMLARLRGQDVDYAQAVRAISIESGGTSLLTLQKGLRALGVPTTILRATPMDLNCMPMPVIAHMLPRREASDSVGHFLLVLQVDDRAVRYIEPNYAASIETVPRNQFFRCWSGYLVAPSYRTTLSERCVEPALWGMFASSLSIGTFPLARSFFRRILTRLKRSRTLFVASVVGASGLASGCGAFHPNVSTVDASARQTRTQDLCRLLAWNTDADLGALPPDSAAEALFRIENQGDSEVCLHLGSPTCRCSEARIDKETLKPGEATDVHMVMRSRPHQAGPADARVYLEADGGKWAEMLSVHAVELGATFPDYTYALGGTSPMSRSVSVLGNVYLKASTGVATVDVPLRGTELDSILVIDDVRVGPPIEMVGCVRRECSFRIALKSPTSRIDVRREVSLPILITADGDTTTHRVRLTVLPLAHDPAGQERRSP